MINCRLFPLYSSSLNLDSAVLSGDIYANKNAVKHCADVIRSDILEISHSLEELFIKSYE